MFYSCEGIECGESEPSEDGIELWRRGGWVIIVELVVESGCAFDLRVVRQAGALGVLIWVI
jgi:hypothetical protein